MICEADRGAIPDDDDDDDDDEEEEEEGWKADGEYSGIVKTSHGCDIFVTLLLLLLLLLLRQVPKK